MVSAVAALSWKVILTVCWSVVSVPMPENLAPSGAGDPEISGVSLTTEKVELTPRLTLSVKVTSLAGTERKPLNTKGGSVHSKKPEDGIEILYGNVTVQWSGDVFMTLIPVIDPLSVTVRVEGETSVSCKSCGVGVVVGAIPASVDWLTSAALMAIGKAKMIFVFISV